MNPADPRYARWALCREMQDAPEIIRRFPELAGAFAHVVAEAVRRKRGVVVTGEGSSILFPGRRALAGVRGRRSGLRTFALGCTEAAEFQFDDYAVLAFSNSGKTAELLRLLEQLERARHDAVFVATCAPGSPVTQGSAVSFVLPIGRDEAFAATRSVIAEALFVDQVFEELIPLGRNAEKLGALADLFAATLAAPVTPASLERLVKARVVYFTGAPQALPELALKCNEIARKPAVPLEGALIEHGPRKAVVGPQDAVVPVSGDPYVALAAGWNLLVEAGLAL
ncbi:MAG TPA: SIS domain-containing protein, partial [Planctomycetota bacterium]|nr:SIS domain-containing protein [Planctomycetota bacterium]